MVEDERYCPDIMKQVSALQGSLEMVNRVLLQNHVETCVLDAVEEGHSERVVDELMETLRYAPGVTGASADAIDLSAVRSTHDHKEHEHA